MHNPPLLLSFPQSNTVTYIYYVIYFLFSNLFTRLSRISLPFFAPTKRQQNTHTHHNFENLRLFSPSQLKTHQTSAFWCCFITESAPFFLIYAFIYIALPTILSPGQRLCQGGHDLRHRNTKKQVRDSLLGKARMLSLL